MEKGTRAGRERKLLALRGESLSWKRIHVAKSNSVSHSDDPIAADRAAKLIERHLCVTVRWSFHVFAFSRRFTPLQNNRRRVAKEEEEEEGKEGMKGEEAWHGRRWREGVRGEFIRAVECMGRVL